MRARHAILCSVFLVFTLVGSLAAYRLWQDQRQARAAASLLPATPDLSRWPKEFSERVAALTSSARGSQATDVLGKLGVLYLANDYTSEAEKVLSIVRQREPQNPKWPYFLGTLRLRAGDKAAAGTFFDEALKLEPGYAPALLQRGDIFGSSGQPEEARELFERRLELLPGDPYSLFALAKLDFARGAMDEAIARLKSISREHPRFQEAHLMLADLLERSGDAAGASRERSYLRGGQPSAPADDAWLDQAYLESYDAYRMQAFGVLRLKGGHVEAALPFLRRALQLDPGDVDVQGVLASALSALKRWDEAEKVLQDGLARRPDDEVLIAGHAETLQKLGKPEVARADLEAASQRYPGKARIKNALGQLLLQAEEPERAAATLRQALELDPLLVDAQISLARAYRKLGQRDSARQAVLRAGKLRPDDPAVAGMLAGLALEERDFATAEEHASRLLELSPNEAEALDLYARIKLQKGNFQAESGQNTEAERTYREGIATVENFGQLHGALGMLLGKQRRFPEAVAEFKRFISAAPSDPFGYLLMGSAYAAERQIEDARRAWTEGLRVARTTKNAQREKQLEQMLRQLGP